MNTHLPRFLNPAMQATRRLEDKLDEIAAGVREFRDAPAAPVAQAESPLPKSAAPNQPEQVEADSRAWPERIASRPHEPAAEIHHHVLEYHFEPARAAAVTASGSAGLVRQSGPPENEPAPARAAPDLMQSSSPPPQINDQPVPNIHSLPPIPDLRPQLTAFVAAIAGQHETTVRAVQQVVDLCAKQQREMQRVHEELRQLSSRLNTQIQRA